MAPESSWQPLATTAGLGAISPPVALNPGNANGAEQLRKLKGEEKPK